MFDARFFVTPNIKLVLLATYDPRLGTKLVELTGIEPVASWLQTRRSPS